MTVPFVHAGATFAFFLVLAVGFVALTAAALWLGCWLVMQILMCLSLYDDFIYFTRDRLKRLRERQGR